MGGADQGDFRSVALNGFNDIFLAIHKYPFKNVSPLLAGGRRDFI
jgi:hypothetical protein